jgi:hypothetical protein
VEGKGIRANVGSHHGRHRVTEWLSWASDEETRQRKGELVDVMFGQRRGETKVGRECGEARGRSRCLL